MSGGERSATTMHLECLHNSLHYTGMLLSRKYEKCDDEDRGHSIALSTVYSQDPENQHIFKALFITLDKLLSTPVSKDPANMDLLSHCISSMTYIFNVLKVNLDPDEKNKLKSIMLEILIGLNLKTESKIKQQIGLK